MEKEMDGFELLGVETDRYRPLSMQKFFGRMHRTLVKREVPLFTMPSAQRCILGTLVDTFPQQWVMKDLADTLSVNRPEISRAVFALEGMGFVVTKGDPVDRRAKLVSATEAGVAFRQECEQHAVDMAREYFSMFYTEQQVAEIAMHLKAVNDFWQGLDPDAYFKDE